jgi:hypothetical protein
MKVIASIEEPEVIKKILKHLGLDKAGLHRDTTVLRPLALMGYSNKQLSSSDVGDRRGSIRFRCRD